MTLADYPHNLDAERAVLSAILNRPDAIDTLELAPMDFYLASHQQIIRAALDVAAGPTPVSVRSVAEALRQRGHLETIGGLDVLLGIAERDWTPAAEAATCAETVKTCSVRRALIQAGGQIAALGYDEKRNLDDQLGEAHSLLASTSSRAVSDACVPLHAALDTWYESVIAVDRDGSYTATGLRDLDQILGGGLWRSDLTILAARPSVGKSALALCIANTVIEAGAPVVWFSLEMPRNQLIGRLVSIHTGIDAQRIRTRMIRQDELPKIASAIDRLHQHPLLIDDTAARSMTQIRVACQKRRAEYGQLGLIVVDYLGLVQASERYAGQRVNEVSEISRAMKLLARDCEAPVLALHQLSRAIEGRSTKVPMLSDLRDSGAVEQDADNVLFIHREELYDYETEKKGIAEVHVSKQRNGPLGVVPLRFDASTTRFADLTYRDMEGY